MAHKFELVICITSTALFNCSESHQIWQQDGLNAYKAHQSVRINQYLQPGVGFHLVQSLLELNKISGQNLVDVVLVSRNDSASGERVRNSIENYNLPITRMSFTSGEDVTTYLSAWKCDLFLSTDENQVRQVLSATGMFQGIAAALVCSIVPESMSTRFHNM